MLNSLIVIAPFVLTEGSNISGEVRSYREKYCVDTFPPQSMDATDSGIVHVFEGSDNALSNVCENKLIDLIS
jgi:hypothetical protein